MTSYSELKVPVKVMNLEKLEMERSKTMMSDIVTSKKEREERAYKHLTLIRVRNLILCCYLYTLFIFPIFSIKK